MFSKEVTVELVKAVVVYGAPTIIDMITHWNDPDPTVAQLQERLEALPKAEDAFPGEPPTE